MYVLVEGQEVSRTECWEGGSFESGGVSWWTWDEGCGERPQTVYSEWDRLLQGFGCLSCCSGLMLILVSMWKLISGVFFLLRGGRGAARLMPGEENSIEDEDEFADIERLLDGFE